MSFTIFSSREIHSSFSKKWGKKHLICRRLVKTGLLLYLRRSPKSQTVYKSFCVEPLHKLERQTERERDRQTERVEPLHALKKEWNRSTDRRERERERAYVHGQPLLESFGSSLCLFGPLETEASSSRLSILAPQVGVPSIFDIPSLPCLPPLPRQASTPQSWLYHNILQRYSSLPH